MNNELNEFARLYGPLIDQMIQDNQRFYDFSNTIRWKFIYDERIANVASCDRETNIISINICSVCYAVSTCDMETIEYYLLHEIRHMYQHLVIKKYKEENISILSEDIIKKWIYEGDHYIRAIDKNNQENKDYFYQDIEMDAFVFSYAVMKFKYNDISKIYVPSVYGKEFYDLVDEWIQYFNDNKENNEK